MYSSFLAGSYGLKFLNGESTAAPAGLVAVLAVAFDLVFIFGCAESLDFLAGDFWFRASVVVLAVRGACALGRASDPADALALGAGALALDFALAAEVARAAFAPGAVVLLDLALVTLSLADDLSAAVDLPPDLPLGTRLPGDGFAAGAAFLAEVVLAAAFFAGEDFAAVLFFGAGLPFPDAFPPDLAFPFVAGLPAALARGRDGVFSVDVAAMILLWFLTRCRARELLDAGDFEGRVNYQNAMTLTI